MQFKINGEDKAVQKAVMRDNPDYITPMNLLPVVIDSIGSYVTRNGLTVEIDQIIDYGINPNVTRFNCKGFVLTQTKGGRIKRMWNTFHTSGRWFACGEHPLDIIRKLKTNESEIL